MKAKSFLERFLSEWPAKILSFAAALLLFFFYRLNRLEERYISVPLAVSVNEEYVPAAPYPRTVRLTLRGEPTALFSVAEDDLHAVADFSGFRGEGYARAPIVVERKGAAATIDPLEILADPPELALGLERKATRIVPVTPSFRGYLEPGYELLSTELSPQEIEIAGPASAVARASDVATDFIELAGRRADFTARVRLLKKDPLVQIVGLETAEFRAVVQKAIAVKSFEALDIAVEGLAPELGIEGQLPFGSLRIQSGKNDLRGFEPPPGVLYLDLSLTLKPGTYALPVAVRLPEGFTEESHEPASVVVKVVPAKELPP